MVNMKDYYKIDPVLLGSLKTNLGLEAINFKLSTLKSFSSQYLSESPDDSIVRMKNKINELLSIIDNGYKSIIEWLDKYIADVLAVEKSLLFSHNFADDSATSRTVDVVLTYSDTKISAAPKVIEGLIFTSTVQKLPFIVNNNETQSSDYERLPFITGLAASAADGSSLFYTSDTVGGNSTSGGVRSYGSFSTDGGPRSYGSFSIGDESSNTSGGARSFGSCSRGGSRSFGRYNVDGSSNTRKVSSYESNPNEYVIEDSGNLSKRKTPISSIPGLIIKMGSDDKLGFDIIKDKSPLDVKEFYEDGQGYKNGGEGIGAYGVIADDVAVHRLNVSRDGSTLDGGGSHYATSKSIKEELGLEEDNGIELRYVNEAGGESKYIAVTIKKEPNDFQVKELKKVSTTVDKLNQKGQNITVHLVDENGDYYEEEDHNNLDDYLKTK